MLIEYAFSVKKQKYFYLVKNKNKNKKKSAKNIYLVNNMFSGSC